MKANRIWYAVFFLSVSAPVYFYPWKFHEHRHSSLNVSPGVLSADSGSEKNLTFCGEKVPLNDYGVVENLEKELRNSGASPSQATTWLKRASCWFPVIEQVLRKNGIPEDFKYLAVAESGLTNVVSPSNATGYWQFLDETARNYGLEINTDVDERYNIEKSTEAACSYFREAHLKFKNWTLVAASYNTGISGLAAQIEKQKTSDFYELYLNEENGNYLYRILAIKEILSHPGVYAGNSGRMNVSNPVRFKKIRVDSSISNLEGFATFIGADYEILRMLNPWIRGLSLTNSDKKIYCISCPEKNMSASEWKNNYSLETAAEICTDSLNISR